MKFNGKKIWLNDQSMSEHFVAVRIGDDKIQLVNITEILPF